MSATTLPIDLRSEQLLSLPQAAGRFPPFRLGRPVNPSTVWRWIAVGVKLKEGRRIKLGAIRLAGRWLTSIEAIERFVHAQTPHSTSADAPTPRTTRQRQRQRAGSRKTGVDGDLIRKQRAAVAGALHTDSAPRPFLTTCPSSTYERLCRLSRRRGAGI